MLTLDEIEAIALGQSPIGESSPDWPLPSEWIQENFYLYDTRELIELYDCQIRPLDRALSRHLDGTYRYRRVIWSWMKKSAKSVVIAAVCHYIATHKPNAQIALIANDQRQAASRVGFYLREAIKQGQKSGLKSCRNVHIPKLESGTIRYPNGSMIEMLAIDPRGEAGGNHDMIVYSELWGWKHTAHVQMWSELTISPNKFGYAQQWIDTYAGYVGESPILEPLYEYGVTEGDLIWDDLEVWEHGDQLTTWVTKPSLHWQTPEYYASEAATLTPEQFQRMHRNQWVSSSSAFIPAHLWQECKGDIPDWSGQRLVIAVDAGIISDCFAVVAVARRNNICYPVIIGVWYPKGKPLDFDGPMAFIMDIIQRYRVQTVVYDPTQLHHPMTKLRQLQIVWVQEYQQGIDRNKSDKMLYDMIRDGEIVHDGNDELTKHILNANRNENTGPDDNKFRIVQRNNNLKIDLAVALSMAVYTSMRLNVG